MVTNAGLVFIGPSSGPMLAMGDKINNKKIAKQVCNCMNVIILLFVLITYSRLGLTTFQASKYWMPLGLY